MRLYCVLVLTISRASGTLSFPANFILIGAMNPCPCGFSGDPVKECTCSSTMIARYQKKIEHEDGRKQAIEHGACPSEKCAGYAEIAANRNYRTPAGGSVRSLLGLSAAEQRSLDRLHPGQRAQVRHA